MSFLSRGRKPRLTAQQARNRRNQQASFKCAAGCGGNVWSEGMICADCVTSGATAVRTQSVAPPPPPNFISTRPPKVQKKKKAERIDYTKKW